MIDQTTEVLALVFLGAVAILFFGTVDFYRKKKRNQKSSEISAKEAGKKIDFSTISRKQNLLTEAELRFFEFLTGELTGHYLIFCQVRLADLLVLPQQNKLSILNRTGMKHVDFVLCEPKNLEIVAAVELDDSSHKRKDRQVRDAFLNELLQATKIPLVRVQIKETYNAADFLIDLRLAVRSTLRDKDITPDLIESLKRNSITV